MKKSLPKAHKDSPNLQLLLPALRAVCGPSRAPALAIVDPRSLAEAGSSSRLPTHPAYAALVKVDRRLLLGTQAELEEALFHSEDSSTLNTSFIERHNLTIRQGCSYSWQSYTLSRPTYGILGRPSGSAHGLLQFSATAQGFEVR